VECLTRYRTIVLAKQDKTADEIVTALHCGACTVQTWVKSYKAGGVEALAERPQLGRPTSLPRDQDDRLRRRLDPPPRPVEMIVQEALARGDIKLSRNTLIDKAFPQNAPWADHVRIFFSRRFANVGHRT
jgi:transposase